MQEHQTELKVGQLFCAFYYHKGDSKGYFCDLNYNKTAKVFVMILLPSFFRTPAYLTPFY